MKRVAKSTVRYRDAGAGRRCGTCAMFHPVKHTCDLVKGPIAAGATCDRWTRRAT